MTSAAQPLVTRSAPSHTEWVKAPTSRRPLDTALRESRGLLAAVVAQVVASAIICARAGTPVLAGPLDAFTTILAAGAVFGTVAFAGELFRRRLLQPASLPLGIAYKRAFMSMRDELLTPDHVAVVAITFFATPIALSAFSAAKQAIPSLHPFAWDAFLSGMGSHINGGIPLWQRLQPVLGKPEITTWLDWFYHRVWTTLLLAVLVWAAISRPSALRRRFLFSYAMLFVVVGTLMALAFASAGPPYYGIVSPGRPDPYAPLFEYLRSVDARSPLLSFRGEAALWQAYSHQVHGLGFGVSAMPSMHVASATLIALYGFGLSRLVGGFLTLVAIATFIASVALGWHYALDGYVGATVACLIWWLAGPLTRALA
jgi:hypothetical protein